MLVRPRLRVARCRGRARGLEAESRVVRRVPEQDDDRPAGGGRPGDRLADERATDALALPLRDDADRAETQDRAHGRLVAATSSDPTLVTQCPTIAPGVRLVDGDERQVRDARPRILPERVDDPALQGRRGEGGVGERADRGGVSGCLGTDADPGRHARSPGGDRLAQGVGQRPVQLHRVGCTRRSCRASR